jgi:Uma2 family endonuclease
MIRVDGRRCTIPAKRETAVSADRPDLKLTYDDYLTFPDDGKRHEIIDGEHFVTPAPNLKHQAVSGNLFFALRAFLEMHPLGRLFAAPADVILSDIDVVEPDLLFISNARLDRMTRANIQGAPDLVIEILSPGTRKTDEVTKRKRYEHFDVLEYWIVDPELETVKVLRRTEKGLERVAELSNEEDGRLATPLLPGLSIPLARIFAD